MMSGSSPRVRIIWGGHGRMRTGIAGSSPCLARVLPQGQAHAGEWSGDLRRRRGATPRRAGRRKNSAKFNRVWHVIAPTPQTRPGTLVRKRGRIVLLHFVGQMPLAGIAWQAVNYLRGLAKLGYDAWYVEDHGANPYDPRISSVVMDCGYNLAYLRDVMESHGLGERWAYWDAINDVYHGLSRERVRALYAEADGLINLCGATRLRED